MNRFLVWLGVCRHRQISWPQGRMIEGRCVVQCFDCGQRLFYDWPQMRIAKRKGYTTSRCVDVTARVEGRVGS